MPCFNYKASVSPLCVATTPTSGACTTLPRLPFRPARPGKIFLFSFFYLFPPRSTQEVHDFVCSLFYEIDVMFDSKIFFLNGFTSFAFENLPFANFVGMSVVSKIGTRTYFLQPRTIKQQNLHQKQQNHNITLTLF